MRVLKGRGAASNPGSRFDAWTRVAEPDGWEADEQVPELRAPTAMPPPTCVPPPTEVRPVQARRIISRNDSPDLPFSQSVNPYQGCEHGCIYCYARPTHAYLGLSPGLDFERLILAKVNAAERLRAELGARGYVPAPIALGANTDPYQPAERRLCITRDVLEVLVQARLPFTVTTKSALVERDIDLLQQAAANNLVRVFVSLPTHEAALARILEPRACSPARRLQAIRTLARAAIPVGVFASPVIPALTDRHLEQVLEAAAQAGASSASAILLRLPGEVQALFEQWLQLHFPARAAHVMSLMRQMHGGQAYESQFGLRMRGLGVHAELLRQRFARVARSQGLATRLEPMSAEGFRPPSPSPVQGQLSLF
jgi:DNA repair photolyase